MAQTLTSLYVHVIFSTKNRANLILAEIEKELFAYIGGFLKNNESKLLLQCKLSFLMFFLCALAGNFLYIKN
jgi:hypothetical protein